MDVDGFPKLVFDPPLGFSAVPCKSRIGNACSLCLRLAEHDVTMEQAGEISDELLLTRAALLRAFNRQHAAVIRSLPVELVCRIFEFGLVGPFGTHILGLYDPESGSSWRRQKPQAPLIFGMICHHWRKISFSNPHLWSAIPFRLDCKNVELELEVLSSWIQRSLPFSLSIGVWHQYECDHEGDFELIFEETDPIKWEKIIGLVNSVFSRWDCLRLRLPDAALPLLIGNSSRDCPLRELNLESSIPDFDLISQELCMMGTCKPKPTFVHLSKVALRSVGIDWSDARDVTVSAEELKEYVNLLLDAPELQRLTANCTALDVIDENMPEVEHGKLQFLRIEDNRNFKLFDFVTLPALREVEINANKFPVDQFIEMLSRSGEPLTSLKVDTYMTDYVWFWAEGQPTVKIHRLLQGIPSLKELWIEGPYQLEMGTYLEIFRMLAQLDDEGRNFLPNLERLHIQWHKSFSAVGWDILPQILAASSKPLSPSSSEEEEEEEEEEATATRRLGRPLHSLTVVNRWTPSLLGLKDPILRSPGPTVANELKGFVQQGFKVSILVSGENVL